MSEEKKKAGILYLIAGIMSFLLGFYFFNNKLEGLLAISLYIGMFIFMRGFSMIILFFQNKGVKYRSMLLVQGILDVLVGSMFVSAPFKVLLSLPVLLGIWLIMTGAIEIMKSFSLKTDSDKKWYITLFSGIFSILVGIMVFNNPLVSLISINMLVATILIVHGISTILFYFKSRK